MAEKENFYKMLRNHLMVSSIYFMQGVYFSMHNLVGKLPLVLEEWKVACN